MVNSKASNTQELPKCLVCSEPASKRCSGCHEANYCCGDHQKQHWKQHKKVCIPYEVVTTEEQGRYLIASRELKENSMLIQEPPLAFAPADDDTSPNLLHLCLGCCEQIGVNDRCSSCGWPLCSPPCEKASFHTDMECSIFASKSINFPPKKSRAIYGSVLILRLLLQKSKNPVHWKKMLDLNCHNKIQESRFKLKREKEMILENMQEFYGSDQDLYQVIPCDELEALIERVNLNSFVVMRQDETTNRRFHFRGIYSKIGLASHGCVPNTVHTLSVTRNFDMVLRTSVPIKKGEILQYARDDRWIFLGTYQRQVSKLDEKCQFACTCCRCVDPTELGTYISAIKCTASCNPEHYLLPENPLDLNAEAFWRCNGPDCTNYEEQEKIMSILHHFEIDMEKSMARIHQGDMDLSEKLTKLGELYEQFCNSQLHENHFIVRAIQQEFIHFAQPSIAELSLEHLEILIKHLEKLIHVASILIPGGSHHSATLQFCLCQAMLRKKLKAAKEAKTLDVFGSKENLLEYLTRLDKIQKETMDYYEREAAVTSTNKSQNIILKQLKDDHAIVIRDMKPPKHAFTSVSDFTYFTDVVKECIRVTMLLLTWFVTRILRN
ncbi:unnamed protein product [Allacma fusca]|uniref:MYND-type domain-containing protein n=1 Tax=Allacma fusca TaxID=39272 RepID=A0A8J2KAS6_9HEXA|nr:unnamed protein product [Allacma fusca]